MATGKCLSKVIAVGLGLLPSLLAAQTLHDALQEVVRSNPDIQVLAKDRLATDQALREAWGGFLPSANVAAGYGYETTQSPSTGGHLKLPRREASGTINQMLFDGFATIYDVARNQGRVESASYKVLGIAQDSVLRGIQAYLNVLQQQELVKLSRLNLAEHENILTMIRKRTDSGLGRRADLIQAEGRLALARSNLAADEAGLKDAESSYLRVVGTLPEHLSKPVPPAQAHFPATEQEAIGWAIGHHPALKAAKADITTAKAAYEEAKAANYPRFDLQLGSSYDRNIGGTPGNDNSAFAMVRMNYNLYNGGKDLAKQRENAYLHQESHETLYKIYREIVESIRVNWNAMGLARKQLPLARAHKSDALETTIAYRKQFQLGDRSLFDLLDAQGEYYVASRDYIKQEYNTLLTQYQVLNSMGSLLQALNLALPKEAEV